MEEPLSGEEIRLSNWVAQDGGRARFLRLLPPRLKARVSSTSSSRRCRPVSDTKTSSRLTCRVVRRASGRLQAVELVEQGGDGPVRLGDGQRVSVALGPGRQDRVQPGESCGLERRPVAVERELDDVVAAEPGDQLARRAQRDDLALVDDRRRGRRAARPRPCSGSSAGRSGRGPAGRGSRPRAAGATGGRAPSSARRGRAARGRRPGRWRRPAAAAGRRRAAR